MPLASPRPASRPARRGFTLAEMLLAVFILGIGVISIAALFPAGIALQRQATDDTIGPIVAKNAFAILRSKLSQDDFGSFQDFGASTEYVPGQGPVGTVRPLGGSDVEQISGDWGWMRPAFFTNASTVGEPNRGLIDIFAANYTRTNGFGLPARLAPPQSWATEIPGGVVDDLGTTIPLYGIPYNRAKYPLFFDIALVDPTTVPDDLNLQALLEPNITFTQAERSFPQGQSVGGTAPAYYWDCMFRRNGGRVQVAVFVYRVTVPGGETRPYRVSGLTTALVAGATAGTFDATQQTPPIPALFLAPATGGAGSWPYRGGTLPSGYTAANGYSIPPQADEIFGTHRATPFSVTAIWDDWQLPNSWLIDNHGSVHKVLNGRTRQGTSISTDPGQGPVKLQRPIPILPAAPVNGAVPNVTYPAVGGPNAFISGVWFLPQRDARGNILTPVFAAVEEL